MQVRVNSFVLVRKKCFGVVQGFSKSDGMSRSVKCITQENFKEI